MTQPQPGSEHADTAVGGVALAVMTVVLVIAQT
jgi:hypothetical protein